MQDPNNGIHGYTVRSLYFDTIYDKDFFEKRDGIECGERYGLEYTTRVQTMQIWR